MNLMGQGGSIHAVMMPNLGACAEVETIGFDLDLVVSMK
jgi:hypothetical protein